MAVLSVLRTARSAVPLLTRRRTQIGQQCSAAVPTRNWSSGRPVFWLKHRLEINSYQNEAFSTSLLTSPPVRLSEHMAITPSRFSWNLYKDHLHFYFLLGIIPLSLLVLYVNLFIGPPKLADIPEDYEPKFWEYYDHPIKQFFAKHLMENPQQVYEKKMHLLQLEHEKVQLRQLQAKVQKLISERGDYQAWYFVPQDSKYTKYYQEKTVEMKHYGRTI